MINFFSKRDDSQAENEKDKLKIIFVDSEEKILAGLKRNMRSMRKNWDMTFVDSVRAALTEFENQPFNVLVTDIRMPEISGLELLKIVRKKYPSTIRIVLSGYTNQKYILESTKTAHQFLSKPCNLIDLKEIISRFYNLRALLTNPSLNRIAAQIKSIPSLPIIYNDITRELTNPNCSLKKIGEIVERDIGMSAKILQLVNSSFFGTTKRISTPSQATIMLGMEVIRGLIVSANLFEKFKNRSLRGISINLVWEHSKNVAEIAKRIAEYLDFTGEATDNSYIAGLLHDAGKILLAADFPETYNDFILEAKETNQTLHELEYKQMGSSHAEVGGYVMGLWGLPSSIVEAIAFHLVPSSINSETPNVLTVVHLANALEVEKYPRHAFAAPPRLDVEYLKRLKLFQKLSSIRKLV